MSIRFERVKLEGWIVGYNILVSCWRNKLIHLREDGEVEGDDVEQEEAPEERRL